MRDDIAERKRERGREGLYASTVQQAGRGDAQNGGSRKERDRDEKRDSRRNEGHREDRDRDRDRGSRSDKDRGREDRHSRNDRHGHR